MGLFNKEKTPKEVDKTNKKNVEKMIFDKKMKEIEEKRNQAKLNPRYRVRQIVLKEALLGTKSKNLTELEEELNWQAICGFSLHSISIANGGSKGVGGGDRLQATAIFEKENWDTNNIVSPLSEEEIEALNEYGK